MNIADIAAIVNGAGGGGGGGTADPWAMYDLVAYFDFGQGSVSVTKGDFSKTRQKLLEGDFCRGCYYSWDDSEHITFTYDSISMKYIEPDQDQWGERIIVNFFFFDYDLKESSALAASWYPDNTISTD